MHSGSGRVTFSSHTSYLRAVDSAFLEIKTPKFSKKIQIDPYLEEARCSMCDSVQGPYFCRVRSCFKYYCLQCWQVCSLLISFPHPDLSDSLAVISRIKPRYVTNSKLEEFIFLVVPVMMHHHAMLISSSSETRLVRFFSFFSRTFRDLLCIPLRECLH